MTDSKHISIIIVQQLFDEIDNKFLNEPKETLPLEKNEPASW